MEGPFITEGVPKFILTVLDTFSGYVILMPTKKHDARTTAELLMKHVFSYWAFPQRLLSDNGPEYTSTLWKEIGDILSYKLVHTSPYSPQANGQNKRIHRTINNMLRTLIKQKGNDWGHFLPAIQLDINTSEGEGLKHSPYEIMLGRKATLPATLHLTKRVIPGQPNQEYINKLKEQ